MKVYGLLIESVVTVPDPTFMVPPATVLSAEVGVPLNVKAPALFTDNVLPEVVTAPLSTNVVAVIFTAPLPVNEDPDAAPVPTLTVVAFTPSVLVPAADNVCPLATVTVAPPPTVTVPPAPLLKVYDPLTLSALAAPVFTLIVPPAKVVMGADDPLNARSPVL